MAEPDFIVCFNVDDMGATLLQVLNIPVAIAIMDPAFLIVKPIENYYSTKLVEDYTIDMSESLLDVLTKISKEWSLSFDLMPFNKSGVSYAFGYSAAVSSAK